MGGPSLGLLTVLPTKNQNIDGGLAGLVQIWRKIRVDLRLARDMSELAATESVGLRDLGISRMEIAAIRAGTYRRASADDAERIVFCPEAGKPVTRRTIWSQSAAEGWCR